MMTLPIKAVTCPAPRSAWLQSSLSPCTEKNLPAVDAADDGLAMMGKHPFALFCRIRWPEGKERRDAEEESTAVRQEDDAAAVASGQTMQPPPVLPEHADAQSVESGAALTETRMWEIQALFRKMVSGIDVDGDRAAFTVTLSHALFAGTCLGIRLTPLGIDVDYGSDLAAETEWFDRHAEELANRLASVTGRRVRVRALKGSQ